ncbi:hypothetical protein CMV_012892 [Castanea mollissima]|uniref:Response regulatory domain-containing protein n=1 Tax=Castanea mollissima TaxID=60419 RepID=A0A8J4VVJ4_9ROSI|nr:hypothetical protein CMV_012892 [Castanea mollissima]
MLRKTSLSLVFLQIAMDKGKQIIINNNGGHAGRSCNNSTMTSDAFNNQSKLKILLCDSDPESCDEISTLLTKCRYQVISVNSFVEVVDTLDAEGPHIDILLVSVDPHIDKGMKMLKYISEEFQHIPVIINEKVTGKYKCRVKPYNQQG